MKKQVPDDERLTNLLCEVEGIVNNWPITKVSDDPKDLEALTPNHLLLLRKGPKCPPVCLRMATFTCVGNGDKFNTLRISFGSDGRKNIHHVGNLLLNLTRT